ncbi:hypothetical protein D9756_010001 [Leucocoprinus leucothites]|uniref:PHD-type domain-containing protein n=1 Tax=Leucocoprinus leucothites TaxID=201217 RepID=A0A8H5FRW1_9AGAR|nr:hypothetical protein D9756_010001 [Leucoagaricus leucothites]
MEGAVGVKRKAGSTADTDDGDGDANAIRCICGSKHDDGFSIACDKCSRWVHAACFGIVNAKDVPEVWKCWLCEVKPAEGVEKRPQRTGRGTGGNRVRRASALASEPVNKRRRRPSIRQPMPHDTDELDVQEPAMHAYVQISVDNVPHSDARARLGRYAKHWRGLSALTQDPPKTVVRQIPAADNHFLNPYSNASVRPPAYALHTTAPIRRDELIAPYTSTITPSSSYLADPLNAYAHLGMPKPFVHLIGPPLNLALDARISGDKSRFVRNGCRPNAVLRPTICSDSERLAFGVFALRDLRPDEEIILGWEWDDGNAVHSLPALIETPHIFPTLPSSSTSDSPQQIQRLRHQMSNILHSLSSTFTTCACGSKAKDCALNQMAAFVDAGAVHSDSPLSPSLTALLPLPGEKLDLGPLVGKQRGFRTRERLPFSSGMGGVEMDVDVVEPVVGKGKGKEKANDFIHESDVVERSTLLSTTPLSTCVAPPRIQRSSSRTSTSSFERHPTPLPEPDPPPDHARNTDDEDRMPPKLRRQWKQRHRKRRHVGLGIQIDGNPIASSSKFRLDDVREMPPPPLPDASSAMASTSSTPALTSLPSSHDLANLRLASFDGTSPSTPFSRLSLASSSRLDGQSPYQPWAPFVRKETPEDAVDDKMDIDIQPTSTIPITSPPHISASPHSPPTSVSPRTPSPSGSRSRSRSTTTQEKSKSTSPSPSPRSRSGRRRVSASPTSTAITTPPSPRDSKLPDVVPLPVPTPSPPHTTTVTTEEIQESPESPPEISIDTPSPELLPQELPSLETSVVKEVVEEIVKPVALEDKQTSRVADEFKMEVDGDERMRLTTPTPTADERSLSPLSPLRSSPKLLQKDSLSPPNKTSPLPPPRSESPSLTLNAVMRSIFHESATSDVPRSTSPSFPGLSAPQPASTSSPRPIPLSPPRASSPTLSRRSVSPLPASLSDTGAKSIPVPVPSSPSISKSTSTLTSAQDPPQPTSPSTSSNSLAKSPTPPPTSSATVSTANNSGAAGDRKVKLSLKDFAARKKKQRAEKEEGEVEESELKFPGLVTSVSSVVTTADSAKLTPNPSSPSKTPTTTASISQRPSLVTERTAEFWRGQMLPSSIFGFNLTSPSPPPPIPPVPTSSNNATDNLPAWSLFGCSQPTPAPTPAQRAEERWKEKEKEYMEQLKVEQQRSEKLRLERETQERLAKEEREEKERARKEKERLERLEKEREEERERIERDKEQREKAEELKVERERAEREWLEMQRRERERLERERMEVERAEQRAEEERLERERLEEEHVKREKLEVEKFMQEMAKERFEMAKLESESLQRQERIRKSMSAVNSAEDPELDEQLYVDLQLEQSKEALAMETPAQREERAKNVRNLAKVKVREIRARKQKEREEKERMAKERSEMERAEREKRDNELRNRSRGVCLTRLILVFLSTSHRAGMEVQAKQEVVEPKVSLPVVKGWSPMNGVEATSVSSPNAARFPAREKVETSTVSSTTPSTTVMATTAPTPVPTQRPKPTVSPFNRFPYVNSSSGELIPVPTGPRSLRKTMPAPPSAPAAMRNTFSHMNIPRPPAGTPTAPASLSKLSSSPAPPPATQGPPPPPTTSPPPQPPPPPVSLTLSNSSSTKATPMSFGFSAPFGARSSSSLKASTSLPAPPHLSTSSIHKPSTLPGFVAATLPTTSYSVNTTLPSSQGQTTSKPSIITNSTSPTPPPPSSTSTTATHRPRPLTINSNTPSTTNSSTPTSSTPATPTISAPTFTPTIPVPPEAGLPSRPPPGLGLPPHPGLHHNISSASRMSMMATSISSSTSSSVRKAKYTNHRDDRDRDRDRERGRDRESSWDRDDVDRYDGRDRDWDRDQDRSREGDRYRPRDRHRDWERDR